MGMTCDPGGIGPPGVVPPGLGPGVDYSGPVYNGALGPPGCNQSATILNRIVTWKAWGMSWEADPRHAELVCSSLGVAGHSVTTPASKERSDGDEGEPLDEETARQYRSVAMRAAYLSMDRPDL